MSPDEILQEVALAIKGLEAWHEGKTLSVIVSAPEEPLLIAKLRLTGVSSKPTTADLRGEPA